MAVGGAQADVVEGLRMKHSKELSRVVDVVLSHQVRDRWRAGWESAGLGWAGPPHMPGEGHRMGSNLRKNGWGGVGMAECASEG